MSSNNNLCPSPSASILHSWNWSWQAQIKGVSWVCPSSNVTFAATTVHGSRALQTKGHMTIGPQEYLPHVYYPSRLSTLG